jgi:hypothetical protein
MSGPELSDADKGTGDWRTMEEKAADIAQAKALREQARTGGLRFEAYLPPGRHRELALIERLNLIGAEIVKQRRLLREINDTNLKDFRDPLENIPSLARPSPRNFPDC